MTTNSTSTEPPLEELMPTLRAFAEIVAIYYGGSPASDAEIERVVRFAWKKAAEKVTWRPGLRPDRYVDPYQPWVPYGPMPPSPPIERCLFDNLPADQLDKPMWLSCPCPKCSPRC